MIPKPDQPLLKLLLTGFLVLILLVPAVWMAFLINDRSQRKAGVVDEIAGKWGGSQTLSGPFICMPYIALENSTDKDGRATKTELTKYLYLAPQNLNITGKVNTVTHKRGIFKVSGYLTDLQLEARFMLPILEGTAYQNLPVRWQDALLLFDTEDQRGLKELSASLNGSPLVFNQSEGILSTVSLPEPAARAGRVPEDHPLKQTDYHLAANLPPHDSSGDIWIKIRLKLSGTGELSFNTAALRQTVKLEGDWRSPSFSGDMLPESRKLEAKGFSATWSSNELSSGIKKVWTSDEPKLRLSRLGVKFLIPVDSYQQSTRALKYSVLFLVLTFMTFFFAETISKIRIHPIQYLMVGCGLLIFYLLLLAISEYLSFGIAYLISAAAVVLQISLYCASIMKGKGFPLKIGALLSALYAFLYFLLSLEDSALLIGSISLFILLSVAMFLIRKVKWYALSDE